MLSKQFTNSGSLKRKMYKNYAVNVVNSHIRIFGLSERLDNEIILQMFKSQNRLAFKQDYNIKFVCTNLLRKNPNALIHL